MPRPMGRYRVNWSTFSREELENHVAALRAVGKEPTADLGRALRTTRQVEKSASEGGGCVMVATSAGPTSFSAWCRKVYRDACGRPAQCDIEFIDPELFEKHLTAVHGARRLEASSVFKRWRLRKARKPYAPTGFDPGADITWNHYYEDGVVQRTGQVWSLARLPCAVWVIPYDPRPAETSVVVQKIIRHRRIDRGPNRLPDFEPYDELVSALGGQITQVQAVSYTYEPAQPTHDAAEARDAS